MNWLLRQRLVIQVLTYYAHLRFFLTSKRSGLTQTQAPPEPLAAMRKAVNFTFYQMEHREDTDQEHLALVRYTFYGIDERVQEVEQVIYKDDDNGYRDFRNQVVACLECGVDVTVLTPYELDYFPFLEAITD